MKKSILLFLILITVVSSSVLCQGITGEMENFPILIGDPANVPQALDVSDYTLINVGPSNIKGITENFPEIIEIKEYGQLKPYSPSEQTMTKFKQPDAILDSEWSLLDSFYVDSYLPAGANIGVKLNKEDKCLDFISPYNLTSEALAAIEKAPAWLRIKLKNTLGLLGKFDQRDFAAVINEAENPYLDEICFAMAYSSPLYLKSKYCHPELFLHNAQLIYENDKALPYVEVMDYGLQGVDEDYYSTVAYWKKDTSGNKVQVEVPKEIYYFYIVFPKLSDEIAAYIDPERIEHDANYGNHIYNITDPEKGFFWRDYLFNHTEEKPDTTGDLFPILKEQSAKAEILWDDSSRATFTAIRAVTNWVNDVMNFTSEAERPHQPIRIYDLHIGRCGEHEDLTNAAARSCLIPCRGISTISTDHVWNEYWDEHWRQWEPVNNSIDNIKCYSGRKFGTVFARRSDGVLNFRTKEYAKEDRAATLNVYIKDNQGAPVDGALMILYVNHLTEENQAIFDSYCISDNEGKCTFIVGTERRFFCQVRTSIGNFPPESGYVANLVENPEDGKIYNFNVEIAAAKMMADFSEVDPPADELDDYKFVNSFGVVSHHTNWNLIFNDLSGEYTTFNTGMGTVNYFVTNEDNYDNCRRKYSFDVCQAIPNAGGIDVPVEYSCTTEDDWVAFLNNGSCMSNYMHVRGYFSLYITDAVPVEERPADDLASGIRNFPNPFTDNTAIQFFLRQNADVKLNIYNVAGNFVTTLADRELFAGEHNLVWNGTSNNGRPMGSGIYYYVLDIGQKRYTGEISLVR